MPLQTVAPQRLYQQIADQLRTLITAGEFTPGSRLPAERDLAKHLGVDISQLPLAGAARPALAVRPVPSASVISSSDTFDSDTRSIKVLSFRRSIFETLSWKLQPFYRT